MQTNGDKRDKIRREKRRGKGELVIESTRDEGVRETMIPKGGRRKAGGEEGMNPLQKHRQD